MLPELPILIPQNKASRKQCKWEAQFIQKRKERKGYELGRIPLQVSQPTNRNAQTAIANDNQEYKHEEKEKVQEQELKAWAIYDKQLKVEAQVEKSPV